MAYIGSINELFEGALKNMDGVSDVYVKGDGEITIRKHGEIHYKFEGVEDNCIMIKNSIIKDFISENLSRYDKNFLNFKSKKRFDFRYSNKEKDFRVNASICGEKYLLVFRKINQSVISLDKLGIDTKYLEGVLNKTSGLFLVSGPTGSGKSTTLSSIVDEYNKNTRSHIITLEDPIEQKYTQKNSVIHQFELGDDFNSFEEGLENILRQDPDIIVIGEIRNKETLDVALKLAETGHLVFGTIHGKGADGVVGKIIRMYDNPKQISGMLADVLIGILFQQKFSIRGGETLICLETLYNDPIVRAGFLQGKSLEFQSNMQTGIDSYMVTREQYLTNYLKGKYNLNGKEYGLIFNGIKGQ